METEGEIRNVSNLLITNWTEDHYELNTACFYNRDRNFEKDPPLVPPLNQAPSTAIVDVSSSVFVDVLLVECWMRCENELRLNNNWLCFWFVRGKDKFEQLSVQIPRAYWLHILSIYPGERPHLHIAVVIKCLSSSKADWLLVCVPAFLFVFVTAPCAWFLGFLFYVPAWCFWRGPNSVLLFLWVASARV